MKLQKSHYLTIIDFAPDSRSLPIFPTLLHDRIGGEEYQQSMGQETTEVQDCLAQRIYVLWIVSTKVMIKV